MLKSKKEISGENYRLIEAIYNHRKKLTPEKTAELQMLVSFAQYIEEVHLECGKIPDLDYAKQQLIKNGVAA